MSIDFLKFTNSKLYYTYYMEKGQSTYEQPAPAVIVILSNVSGNGYDPIKQFIFAGESSNYDAMYRSTTYAKVVPGGQTCMTQTIATVVKNGTKYGKGGSDVAIGRYQNLAKYILKRATDAGLDPIKDLYNEENQEKMGESLINAACGKYINSENIGSKTDLQNAIQKLGRAWASLPIVIQGKKVKINDKWQWINGDTVGDIDSGTGKKAYYTNSANAGGNSTKDRSVGEAVQILIKTRKNLNKSTSFPTKPEYIPTYVKWDDL